MPSKRPLARLRDIRDNGLLILSHTAHADYDSFCASPRVRDTVEPCLLRIAQDAVLLGPLGEKMLPEHDWAAMRALGDTLGDADGAIDQSRLWSIVSVKVPTLLEDISLFLDGYPDDQEELE